MDKLRIRLDRLLKVLGFGKRESLKQMIKDELILVNYKIVKSNAYIVNEDIISYTLDDTIITFQVILQSKDNKILVSVNPLKKESVKEYTC